MSDNDDTFGFVVPWSGEIIAPPIPLPEPLPPPLFPIGGSTDTSPDNAFPQLPSLSLHIPRPGDLYTWTDVKDWATNAIHAGWDVLGLGAGAVSGAVRQAIDQAISVEQTVIANFTSLVLQYLNMALEITLTDFLTLTETAAGTIALAASIYDSMIRHFVDAEEYAAVVAESIGIQLYDRALAYADALAGNVEGWAIDNIWTPLDDEITRVERDLTDRIDGVVGDIEGWAQDLVNGRIAGVLATLAALGAAVSTLTTEATECTEPMCDYAGPNSNVGNALKKLEGLLKAGELLGFAAFLEQLDAKGVEGFVKQIASEERALAGDLAEFFTGGTETLGDLFAKVV